MRSLFLCLIFFMLNMSSCNKSNKPSAISDEEYSKLPKEEKKQLLEEKINYIKNNNLGLEKEHRALLEEIKIYKKSKEYLEPSNKEGYIFNSLVEEIEELKLSDLKELIAKEKFSHIHSRLKKLPKFTKIAQKILSDIKPETLEQKSELTAENRLKLNKKIEDSTKKPYFLYLTQNKFVSQKEIDERRRKKQRENNNDNNKTSSKEPRVKKLENMKEELSKTRKNELYDIVGGSMIALSTLAILYNGDKNKRTKMGTLGGLLFAPLIVTGIMLVAMDEPNESTITAAKIILFFRSRSFGLRVFCYFFRTRLEKNT